MLLCDATVRSPLTGEGLAIPAAHRVNGVALKRAEQQKAAKYGDVCQSGLCKLVTLACETGGRWNYEAIELVDRLAVYKAKDAPPALRRSVQLAYVSRWSAMVGVAVQDAIAASLLAPAGRSLVLDQSAAPAPSLDALLEGQYWAVDFGADAFFD